MTETKIKISSLKGKKKKNIRETKISRETETGRVKNPHPQRIIEMQFEGEKKREVKKKKTKKNGALKIDF